MRQSVSEVWGKQDEATAKISRYRMGPRYYRAPTDSDLRYSSAEDLSHAYLCQEYQYKAEAIGRRWNNREGEEVGRYATEIASLPGVK